MRLEGYGFLIAGQKHLTQLFRQLAKVDETMIFSRGFFSRFPGSVLARNSSISPGMPCDSGSARAFHELVLIRPCRAIPKTERAMYFQYGVMGSIQINRFSSQENLPPQGLMAGSYMPQDCISWKIMSEQPSDLGFSISLTELSGIPTWCRH